MRILYSFPHRVGAPGIGVTAEQQIRGLVAHGHDVDLWCASSAVHVAGVRSITSTLEARGRRIPRRALGFERALAYHDWRVARALRGAGSRYEAVHCWGLGSLRTLEAAQTVGVHSFREVTNTHTAFSYARASREARALGVRMPRNHSHRPDRRRLRMEEREFRTADTLLVPSDYVRQTFRDRGFDDQQLVRHQYGFDPARFPEPTAPTADTHMPLRACFVGHGEPRKGLHHALSAWIESGVAATGELVVCGRILPAYGRVLSPLLGHRSVTTIGFTSDVGAVMRACDVLILPSVEEGSALVTYEAQASGCVLLVSEAAGAVVGIDTALVHRPGDVAALAAHLRLLDADRSRLAAMRARTLARRGQLTWEAAASRLDAIYRARVEDSG